MAAENVQISIDSELLTTLVSADPVSSGDHFTAIVDQNGAPAVFSLSTDGKLLFIVQDATALDDSYVSHDFGSLWGATDKVTGFDVLQTSDKRLAIALAVRKDDQHSVLLVLPSLAPADLLSPSLESVLGKSSSFPYIETVFMSDFVHAAFGGHSYPEIMIAYKPMDRVTSTQDLGLIKIDPNNGNLSTPTWSLPINPDNIVDVAFASTAIGLGVVVLYEIAGARRLVFSTYDGSGFNATPTCPAGTYYTPDDCYLLLTDAGANGVETYFDATSGSSCAIVSADGLYHFTSRGYMTPDTTGTQIASGDNFNGLIDLQVVQDGNKLLAFFTNGQKAIGYFSAQTNAVTSGSSSMLFSSGEADQLSCLLRDAGVDNNAELLNTVVYSQGQNQLNILQQESAGGTWRSSPITISSPSDNLEIDTYMTRIKLGALNGGTTSFAQVQLKATGFVVVTVNGQQTRLDTQGSWYQVDAAGELTIVMPVDDVSCTSITLEQANSATGDAFTFTARKIDPSIKAFQKLQTLGTKQGLLDAKTQRGDALIDPSQLADDDIGHASDIMGALNQQANALNAASSGSHVPQFAFVGGSVSHALIAGKLTKTSLSDMARLTGSISESLAEAWRWIQSSAQQVSEWAIHVKDGVVQFFVTIGNAAWNFILDNFPALGSCLSFVFSKLKVAFRKVVDYLGFVFSWSDILQTKQVISAYINGCFDYGVAETNALAQWVNAEIAKLRDNVKPRTVNVSPITKRVDGKDQTENGPQDVSYNWANYQLTHGAGVSNVTYRDPSSDDAWTVAWNMITQTWESIQDLFEALGQGLSDLLSSQNSTDANDALNKLSQNVIDAGLSALQTVATGIISLVAKFIAWLKDQANETINIPIFSSLWKKISGAELSLLDLISLIIAIPVTVLGKIMTGKSPAASINMTLDQNFVKELITQGSLPTDVSGEFIDLANLVCIATTGVGVYLSNLAFLTSVVPVSVMSTGSKAVTRPQRLRTLGHITAMAAMDDRKLITIIDSMNLIVGVVGLGFSFPLIPPHSTVDPSLTIPLFGLNAFRQMISAVRLYMRVKNLGNQTVDKVFAGFNVIVAVPTAVMSCIVAANGPADDQERAVIQAIMTLLGTCCKSTATIVGPTKPLISVPAQGAYVVISAGVVLIQVRGTAQHISNLVKVSVGSQA